MAERLASAAELLEAVSETPRLDAEILLAHALHCSRAQLLARLRAPADVSSFDDLVRRRLGHEPVAYIIGKWEFFSLRLEVARPLLVPRPETEHVVEAVLDRLGQGSGDVLDLCTGTGCIAVAIAFNLPRIRVVAVDIHPLACTVTTRNARLHHVEQRVHAIQGDLFGPLQPEARFAAICANPPYVEWGEWDHLPPAIRLHEDPGALLAGPDGLDFVERIAAAAPGYLEAGGMLALEVGMGQNEMVSIILQNFGYRDIRWIHDLAGIPRVVTATRPSHA